MPQVPKYPTTNFAADIRRIVKNELSGMPTLVMGTVTDTGGKGKSGYLNICVEVAKTGGGTEKLVHKKVPIMYRHQKQAPDKEQGSTSSSSSLSSSEGLTISGETDAQCTDEKCNCRQWHKDLVHENINPQKGDSVMIAYLEKTHARPIVIGVFTDPSSGGTS